MTKVKEIIAKLKSIKKDREENKLFCIPFYEKFPKLANFIPGIIKGILYKVTAGSGIGKTQFTKQLFCILPLDYIRNHPETNLKVKILYFALEESEEEFINSLIVNRLAIKHNIRIDTVMLKGYKEEFADDYLIQKIEECTEEVEYYMNHITIIDSVYNPTGLYKYCRTVSEQEGTHVYKEDTFIKEGKKSTELVYDYYKPNDENLHRIVICDHISLLQEEYDSLKQRQLTKHEAIAKWSTDYCKKQITKHWNWTAVNVQQQEQSNEKQQFTIKGESIIAKTEPTLDALANNKEIQRDDYIILSLYSPDKFGITDYNAYDISRFRDTFRAVKILKNRLGKPNKYVNFLFDGATNSFAELPFPNEREKLKPYLLKADELLNRKQNE